MRLGDSPEPDLVHALVHARLGDPFALLGPHRVGDGRVVRAYLPGAVGASLVDAAGDPIAAFECIEPSGLFVAPLVHDRPYRIRTVWPGGVDEREDPYAYPPLLSDLDLHLIAEGRHRRLADALGAHPLTIGEVDGVRFAVWAPNARRVSVVGDFNQWDGRRHPMRLRYPAGVWELFVPRVAPGARYQFEIVGAHGELLPLKADPCAREAERAPQFAAIVAREDSHAWRDASYIASRAQRHAPDAPISVYELHAPSWLRPEHRQRDDDALSWDALAERLVPYVAGMGFTHVELLPVMEYPFGGSWGYQPLGLFAPTARHGDPAGFQRFVDAAHEAGVGVILDWVPAHFPTDAHGLARFDGTALYEHGDPREGFHRDWNTLIYDFGRNEVRGFLIASALEWLERHHVDGLRVDAVASMLYRDYSRKHGEWVPNVHGGRENYEAEAFLRELNDAIRERVPGAVVIAEESTAWPGVTAPTVRGGLGFHYKWNMGWMHDTLAYLSRETVHRRFHHHEMTFGLVYAWSERFMLPLSHDEVVHGKRSLLGRMPGDRWQQHANLRAYYAFMFGHPGKKLLFMGAELAQDHEWRHDGELPWHTLGDPLVRGTQRLVRDLNHAYVGERALHARDTEPHGFEWVVGDDAANSVFAFVRHGHDGDAPVLVVVNLTAVPREGYRIGVPRAGRWRELVNTDAHEYGGSGVGNGGAVESQRIASHGKPQSVMLTLPPLATLFLRAEA